jgi:hypothetical protein
MSYNKIDMAKRKQKAKRTTRTKSSSQRLQNISKININIGKEFERAMKEKRNDQVSLMPSFSTSTTFLPTTPQTTTLLEAPNRQYANIPQPLRRNVYATLPAVSNPVTSAPISNGSARDPQPRVNAPIIQDTNPNDLVARQVSYTAIKPSPQNMIPNLSSASSMLSTPSRSLSSTPTMVPPVMMLTPRQRGFSVLDLLERNPNEGLAPIDTNESIYLSSLPASASDSRSSRQPAYTAQPYQSPPDAKKGRGRPGTSELKDRSKYYENEYMKMLASMPK